MKSARPMRKEELQALNTLRNNIRNHNYIKMISVSDDWYPNFPGDKVEVHISMYSSIKRFGDAIRPIVMLSFWGADDHCLCKQIQCETYEDAVRIWNEQVKWFEEEVMPLEPIDAEYLRTFGFITE